VKPGIEQSQVYKPDCEGGLDQMLKNKLALAGGVLAMAIAAGTGCSSEKAASPDVKPGIEQSEQAKNMMQTTIYAADSNGYVVPLHIKMGQTTSVAKATLERMVRGGTGDAALTGTGLRNILPEGTEVRGVVIQDGLAKVDFTKNVLEYETAQEEQAIVEAVVWTLTSLENVKKVQFMVEGRVQPTLKKGTPVADPISRENGINLQVAKDVNPSNATKLTLYFSAKDPTSAYSYLVPVTRIVPKVAVGRTMVDVTMEELAKGPSVKGLKEVMAPTMKPVKSDVKDKVATLDFGDDFKAAGASEEGKTMVNSIVLSLAANADVNQIKFTVGGKAPQAANGLDFTKPVALPQVINSQKL